MNDALHPAENLDSTIVVETFNYLEGTSLDSVRAALRAASGLVAPRGGIEVILADVSGEAEISRLVAEEFPHIRYLDAVGLGYDEAKARAAENAHGRYVVYLDCDCIPEPGWFERLTAPLRSGTAMATAGFAWYGGGFWSQLQWLLDFGFLLPRQDRAMGCYPSNNSAFVRELLLRIPEPDGPMRCRCYAHAQLLARMGTPVTLVADAAVTHEPPPFFRERLRQGYDMVASCWVDPALSEARWLRYGIAAAPLLYRHRIELDWRALRKYGDQAAFRRIQRAMAYPLIAISRLLDAAGMIGALALGPAARGLFDRTSRRGRDVAMAAVAGAEPVAPSAKS